MKTLCRHTVTLLALCLGTALAGAQSPQPYPMEDGTLQESGPIFRFGLGPSVFQNGRLTSFGGPANAKVEYHVGFAADAAVGYAFNRYLSAEFEFGGIGTQIQSVPGFFSNHSYFDNVPFLATLTLSCPIPHTIVTPYIGGGGGGSLTAFGTDGFGNSSVAVFGNESDLVYAWEAFAGLRFQLNPRASISVGYKYFTTGDPSFSYPPAFPGPGPNLSLGFEGPKTHSVMVSLRCTF